MHVLYCIPDCPEVKMYEEYEYCHVFDRSETVDTAASICSTLGYSLLTINSAFEVEAYKEALPEHHRQCIPGLYVLFG